MWDRDEFEKWMQTQGVSESTPLLQARVNTGMWRCFGAWLKDLVTYKEPPSITRTPEGGDVANRAA